MGRVARLDGFEIDLLALDDGMSGKGTHRESSHGAPTHDRGANATRDRGEFREVPDPAMGRLE